MFFNQFLEKLNDQRRGVIHQLRAETAPKIFGRNPLYYERQFDRSELPEFVAEICFPGGKFSKFAPILFPDRVRDMRVFLKCRHLALVSDSIVFLDISMVSTNNSTDATNNFEWP